MDKLRTPHRPYAIDRLPASYIRRRPIVLSLQQTTDAKYGDYTEAGIPHRFAVDGEAEDLLPGDPTAPTLNSLCSAGNFLYLLTPPLRLGKKRPLNIRGNVNFNVVMTRQAFDLVSRLPGPDAAMPYFEVAWVRMLHESSEHVLVEASERYTVARRGFPGRWSEAVPYTLDINLDSEHPIPQQAQDGHMLGLWIRSPAPNYVLQTAMLAAFWVFYDV